MGIYQKNLTDAATHAVSIETVATLRAPGASAAGIPVGQFTDTTANIAASAQTVTAFASGGTFLGSNNKGNPFKKFIKNGKKTDSSDIIINSFKSLGIDALIGIGGDGSLKILQSLMKGT